MVWMYPCNGEFTACTGKEARWFKIDQLGLYGKSLPSEDWGTAIVLKTNKWTSRIPSNLKPGNYLIRHELLALHQQIESPPVHGDDGGSADGRGIRARSCRARLCLTHNPNPTPSFIMGDTPKEDVD